MTDVPSSPDIVSDTTCFVERSTVRMIMLARNDALGLKAVDELRIYTAEDFRATLQPPTGGEEPVSLSSAGSEHEPQHDHRVYFMCECCAEFDPENGVSDRADIAVMPDGTWLCDSCYSDCDKTEYGIVACDVDDFEFPRFEDLPRPAPYAEKQSPDLAQPPAQWQPIETAPKDGTRLILAWDDSTTLPMHWEVGRYRSGTGAGSGWCNTYGHSFGGSPTHWMRPATSSLSSTDRGGK